MRIVDRIDFAEPQTDTVLTIGSFDGVHRGHQHLIRGLVARARETGRLATALTFFPHPRAVLDTGVRPTYLSSPGERAELLAPLGLDLLVVQPFTRALAATPAEAFIGELYNGLRMRELWVGSDFALGRERGGDSETLAQLADEMGFALHIVSPFVLDGAVVSSTRVRALLRKGHVAQVAHLLGRPYAVTGCVEVGQRRGRLLGFRTANLPISPERAMPRRGVYAAWVAFEGQRYKAVVNVGTHPTFEESRPQIEAHLMGYAGNLYGHDLRVHFVAFLRPEMRFDSAEALIAQIRRDTVAGRAALSQEAEARSKDAGKPESTLS